MGNSGKVLITKICPLLVIVDINGYLAGNGIGGNINAYRLRGGFIMVRRKWHIKY